MQSKKNEREGGGRMAGEEVEDGGRRGGEEESVRTCNVICST